MELYLHICTVFTNLHTAEFVCNILYIQLLHLDTRRLLWRDSFTVFSTFLKCVCSDLSNWTALWDYIVLLWEPTCQFGHLLQSVPLRNAVIPHEFSLLLFTTAGPTAMEKCFLRLTLASSALNKEHAYYQGL